MWIEAVLAEIKSARRGHKWQCPAHARTGDHTCSLAVGTRDDGKGAWVQCHGGCEVGDVLKSLKLTMWHLETPPDADAARYVRICKIAAGFPTPKDPEGSPRQLGYCHETFHYYGHLHRKERLRHPQTGQKTLMWESRNPQGEWVPGLLGAREPDMPLYRDKGLIHGMSAGEPIFLVESESSVDAMRGLYATTWAGGASSPPLSLLRYWFLNYDRLIIVPDHDEAGQKCGRVLHNALPRAVIRMSDIEGEDAKDIYQRLGQEQFLRWAVNAKP